MSYRTIFFDLDDTLYPKSSGLWHAILERMNDYMTSLLAMPPDEISSLRQYYLETYGTTLRGLQKQYNIDTDKYLEYVHNLPLDEFIFPDPKLGELLASLPQKKYIFTNADINHAHRVLSILKLGDCFTEIIDIRALGFICKPDPNAYRRALEIAEENDPAECILFDDAPRNLQPARDHGWYTVLVGDERPDPSAHLSLPNLHALPRLMPHLWNHTANVLGFPTKNE